MTDGQKLCIIMGMKLIQKFTYAHMDDKCMSRPYTTMCGIVRAGVLAAIEPPMGTIRIKALLLDELFEIL